MAGHEATTPHVILVSSERSHTILAGQIPQSHCPIIAGTHESREIRRTPLGRPYRLLVLPPCLQYSSGIDVEDEYSSSVSAGYQHSRVWSDFSAVCKVIYPKSCDGLYELPAPAGEYPYAASACDGEGITRGAGGGRGCCGGRKGDVCYWRGVRRRDQLLRSK